MSEDIMNGLKNALIEYGDMLEDWKLKFVSVEKIGNSDFADVSVEITKKRCRKPFIMWKLRVDTVKELVHFDQSSFYRY